MRTIPEVAKDAHLWEREMLVKMDDAGQHTDDVLGRVLDYDAAKLSALRAAGVIA